jgi:hypothetical protein
MDKSNINRYYIYINQDKPVISWDIYDETPPLPELNWIIYLSRALRAMEKKLQVKRLVFYITWKEIDRLPSYGNNVVVVMIGDEWCRIPIYFHKVLAIFKCYGTDLSLGGNPLLKPSYLNFMALIQYLRVCTLRLPGIVNYWWQNLKNVFAGTGKLSPIYSLPLGYYNQLDLPIKPISERSYDVFFAGSVVHRSYPFWSLRHWLVTPKTLARQQMMVQLKKFQEKRPDFKLELSLVPSFFESHQGGKQIYSEKMMDTKICIVPRGTSLETFRYFEGMRYGCVIIAETLPSRWFYDNSPAIHIEDWEQLGKILEQLLDNPELMQQKHQESLLWWKNMCSEAVVGDYIAGNLNMLQPEANYEIVARSN